MEEERICRELYEIVTQYQREEYPRLIRERASYPYLYHLSAIRENLISWLPLTKEMRVLERNAEYGALTGKLLAMAGSVVSVTRDGDGAGLIRARCRQDAGRLAALTEDEWESGQQAGGEEAFDVILIAGNTSAYMPELPELRGRLKTGGRLILADANRLGLKYLAGCQEEYRGGYFTGVEGYPGDVRADRETGAGDAAEPSGDRCRQAAAAPGPRCYTRMEYIRLLAEAGFLETRFYYPYPDHKFPAAIYSDDWLPKRGELAESRRNYDRDRIQLFDEGRVSDTLAEEGLFGEFSNSFLIEAKKRED